MNDLISRDAAIDRIESHLRFGDELYPLTETDKILNYAFEVAASCVYNLPSAHPETAKRIVGKSRDGMTLWYQCDICNEPVDAQDNFCRGCGRRLTDE